MEYTTEHNGKGGFRFDIRNPPEAGAEMQTISGDAVTFDEIGPAGMLACTRKRDGVQNLYFPHDLMGANAGGKPLSETKSD
jgi:hypothetical protein